MICNFLNVLILEMISADILSFRFVFFVLQSKLSTLFNSSVRFDLSFLDVLLFRTVFVFISLTASFALQSETNDCNKLINFRSAIMSSVNLNSSIET